MARRGRKRRACRRQPNGQPSRRIEDSNVFDSVLAQPHRRKYGENFRDQMAECELGRLRLDNIITPVQYDAGVRYRDIVAGMRRAIDAPKGTARSSAGIFGEMSGRVIDLDTIDPEGAKERNDRARAEYANAIRALNGTLNERGSPWRDAVLAVNDMAVWDLGVEQARGGLAALRAGLNVLAQHFGLYGRRVARG